MNKMAGEIKLFVKFGEYKYIKRLFDGKMYFSNALKFREIETKAGIKGQGDASEAFWQLKNANAAMIDYCTGQTIFQPNLSIFVEFANTGTVPVFCITYLSEEDYEIEEKDGRRILTVSGISRDTIKSHFPKADTAVVFFQPQRFIESLAALGLPLCDKVRYFDFSPDGIIIDMVEYICQNPGIAPKHSRALAPKCWEATNGECTPYQITKHNMCRVLFCKSIEFSEEKEFRVLLPQKRIPEPKEYAIRWGNQLKTMCTLEEFFNGVELPRQALQKVRTTDLKHP